MTSRPPPAGAWPFDASLAPAGAWPFDASLAPACAVASAAPSTPCCAASFFAAGSAFSISALASGCVEIAFATLSAVAGSTPNFLARFEIPPTRSSHIPSSNCCSFFSAKFLVSVP